MTYVILGLIGAALASSGWVFAWRARGEANAAGDRARLAESLADARLTRVPVAMAEASTAVTQYRALQTTLADTQNQLARERAGKAELLEQLAKIGAPVGDVLFDNTIDRLYKNRDRAGGGQGSGPGGGADDLPGAPAGGAPDPAKKD
jgi:hypothetical protein